jgi:hypothetical protein
MGVRYRARRKPGAGGDGQSLMPEQGRPGLVIRGALDEMEPMLVRLDGARPAPAEPAPVLAPVTPPAAEATEPASDWRAWGRWLWLTGLVVPWQYACGETWEAHQASRKAAQLAAARRARALRHWPDLLTWDRADG